MLLCWGWFLISLGLMVCWVLFLVFPLFLIFYYFSFLRTNGNHIICSYGFLSVWQECGIVSFVLMFHWFYFFVLTSRLFSLYSTRSLGTHCRMEARTTWTTRGGGWFTSAPPLSSGLSHPLVSEVTTWGDASSSPAGPLMFVLFTPCVSPKNWGLGIVWFSSNLEFRFCFSIPN